ncbi:hypothetical protein KW782_00995 [Candidatus Parcubacteria bacterium]|nr:hypothetical protein [Candidatus Parcubacteria bacterium]
MNRKNIAVWVSLAALIIVHLILLSKTFYIDPDGSIRTAGAGYGDIPYHLTEITKFAFSPFDLNEPIFYGTKLHYPFVINLISGLLLGLTGLWTFSVMAPAYLCAIASVFLIFFIFKRCFNHRGWAIAAIMMFYLGGGMSGTTYIIENTFYKKDPPRSSETILLGAKYPEQNITYGAPLVQFFLHQRTFIIGFFAFLCTVSLFILTFERKRWKYAIAGGVALGIMPLIHTHSFVAASCLLGCILLYAILKRNTLALKQFGLLLGIAVVIALPQMVYLLGQKSFSEENTFSLFRLGWMILPAFGSVQFPSGVEPTAFSVEFLKFLWMNFGFFIPLFIAAVILIIKQYKQKDAAGGYIVLSLFASGILFFAANIIRFQPWDYDNNKIMAYAVFFAIPPIIYTCRYWIDKKKIIGIPITIISIAIIVSAGIIDITPRLTTPYQKLLVIFNTSDRDVAEYIIAAVPEQDLILTGDYHLNPVVSLAGRPVLVGYPGWIWTHGIAYGERLDEIKKFYHSPNDNLNFLEKYPIRYVMQTNQTRNDYKADVDFFERTYEKVYNSGQYTLYKIK